MAGLCLEYFWPTFLLYLHNFGTISTLYVYVVKVLIMSRDCWPNWKWCNVKIKMTNNAKIFWIKLLLKCIFFNRSLSIQRLSQTLFWPIAASKGCQSEWACLREITGDMREDTMCCCCVTLRQSAFASATWSLVKYYIYLIIRVIFGLCCSLPIWFLPLQVYSLAQLLPILEQEVREGPVSYTHLTLPTILLV